MKTSDVDRAYSRGYAAGRRRRDHWSQRLHALAKVWRQKAVEGYGGARCDACARWTRGGPTMKWGTCGQDHADAVDLGCAWAENERYNPQFTARIVCHENFACVNWTPIAAPAARGDDE